MEQWYTLYTKPNAEYKVAAALQRRGLEIYLPEIENPTASQSRQSSPFFPCYFFLRIDFEIVGLSRIQWTPGLHYVLTFGDRPVPVSNKVIDLLRHKLGEIAATDDRPMHTFKSSDVVQISDGPLQEMLKILEEPTTSGQRVRVLLNILGHASRLPVNLADLEKAPLSTEASKPKRPRRTRGRGHRIRPAAEPA